MAPDQSTSRSTTAETEAWARATGMVRPGSRAGRLAQPVVRDVLRELAERYGVCTCPLVVRRIDRQTGQIDGYVEIPCGARLASKCKPCANRNRKLRQRQIREGWHLTEEPTVVVEKPTSEVLAMMRLRAEFLFERDLAVREQRFLHVQELDEGIAEVDELLAGQRLRGTLTKPDGERKPRLVRSTRRRRDFGDLPRRKVENRSIGRLYHSKDGSKSYNHSTLLTLTLPSFGAVHTGRRMRRGALAPCECGALHGERDPMLGAPIDPSTYDYRGHALALIFFSELLDRFWQNLRRHVGYKVAYAGAVEMQKRLATHVHYAVRGTIARVVLKEVAAKTYFQAWWPQFDTMVYSPDRPPVWDDESKSYVDPKTGAVLPTFRQVVAAIPADAEATHVVQLGTIDVRGIQAGTEDAERAIRYATKYITKDLVDQTMIKGDAQAAHFRRLYEELSVLPCSPRCANWPLYGVQPEQAKKGLCPGACKGKVHQPATLGYTGRRCLVSRNWSGKTLTDHRLDGQAWLRAIVTGQLSDESAVDADDGHRYYYELAGRNDLDVPPQQERIFHSIAARLRARQAIQAARDRERGTGLVPAMAA